MLKEQSINLPLFPVFDNDELLYEIVVNKEEEKLTMIDLSLVPEFNETELSMSEINLFQEQLKKNYCNISLIIEMQKLSLINEDILSLTINPEDFNNIFTTDEKYTKYINFNYFDQTGNFKWDGSENVKTGRIVSLKIKLPKVLFYNFNKIDFNTNNFPFTNIYLKGSCLIDDVNSEEGSLNISDAIASEEEPD